MRPVGTVGRFLPQGQTAEATDSRYLGASCKGRVASQVRRVAASYLEFLTWRSLTSQTPRKYERCVEELIEPFGSCIQLGSEPDRAVELNHSPFFLLHPFLPFSFWLCALAASRPGWWLVPSGGTGRRSEWSRDESRDLISIPSSLCTLHFGQRWCPSITTAMVSWPLCLGSSSSPSDLKVVLLCPGSQHLNSFC